MRTLSILTERLVKSIRNIISRTYLVKNLKGDIMIISSSCKICSHIERARIDRKMIFFNVLLSKVAETYNISLEDLVKHYVKHVVKVGGDTGILSSIFRKRFVRYVDLQEELLKLIDRLNALFKMLEKFDEGSLDILKTKPTPRDYIASIDKRRKIIEEIRKTLSIINKIRDGVKDEKDVSDLLRKLREKNV
ncbi:MAG: hypothetical protein NZ929_06530 [Aigarchaeota archaeon]|nr:hypothetical protein [Aigarchaeota archaeon]MCX8192406.1 hypothetical protein [Nitrososphaeria archaeon]MDW7986612.1 hypothetical protein [Nitrososphaerota archaeon]